MLFKPCFQQYLNSEMLKQAKSISYTVSDKAPNTEADLVGQGSQHLIIWSGQSDKTIFQDASVNWAFRAIHDALHLKSGLGFSVQDEIILGNLQSSLVKCPLIAEIVRIEIVEQAKHYQLTNTFVNDQIGFMRQHLINNKLFKGIL